MGFAESAEALAEAFSSVFVHEPKHLPDVEEPVFESESDILTDIVISHDIVKDELKNLNCFKLPDIWKSANLSALFKNGSKTDPLNYGSIFWGPRFYTIHPKKPRKIGRIPTEYISQQNNKKVQSKACTCRASAKLVWLR